MTNQNIPTEASVLLDFLNSNGMGVRPDSLNDPEVASDIVASLTREFRREKPRRGTVHRLRQLRDALRVVIDERTPAASANAWKIVNNLSASVLFCYSISVPSIITANYVRGDKAVSRILQCVATLMQAGQWNRVKICAHGSCSAAFYDATRSKTQRWHSFAICGNANNVAAYRSRSALRTNAERVHRSTGKPSRRRSG